MTYTIHRAKLRTVYPYIKRQDSVVYVGNAEGTMSTMLRSACLIALPCLLAGTAPARPAPERVVFSVVMMRHGVRSPSKPKGPQSYAWANWSPVAPDFLTRHGYRLATFVGRFYRSYFASLGTPLHCSRHGELVYADTDQRTLETGLGVIQGVCGTAGSIALYHDVQPSATDTLFDGADWLVEAGRINSAASRAAVAVAAGPLGTIVQRHGAAFAALQSLLDRRCTGPCASVTSGASSIRENGIAELRGPVDAGEGDVSNIFLEYAQCRPLTSMGFAGEASFLPRFLAAMQLRVLEYDINARNAYNPLARGGNVFAHIVGLLEKRAGIAHPDVAVPNVGGTNVAFIVGHDTELGALGGILDAHWNPGNGIVADDMPPDSALVFELLESGGNYRIRLRFVTQTLRQFRTDRMLPGGVVSVPVRFAGCSGDDCTISLARLAAIAHALDARGFVMRRWTRDSDADVPLPPLADPAWTRCDG